MKKLILTLIFLIPNISFAAGGGVQLQHANTDIRDKASLQKGAQLFVNYCLGCHSANYMRYQRIATDLGLTNDEVKDNLMFTTDKIGDTLNIAMDKNDAEKWFGVIPPDLSVIARARGTDWLYTYLLSFYLDPSRPTGVNNLVFKDVGMPHVLWERQGWQKLVHKEDGTTELQLVNKDDEAKAKKYRQDVRNLVNFLDYVGEPAKAARYDLGWKVILYLTIFLIFAYALKKEYWRDVH